MRNFISRSRIIHGVAANVLGKLYVSILQLVSVPALITAWGVEDYGIWLVLTTVPTYLAMSDFGFSQAATADMTMSIAKGDLHAAKTTFQSLLKLIIILSSAIIFLTVISSFFVFKFNVNPLWLRENLISINLLILYALISQIGRVVLSGFHSSGNYAFGTSVFDTFAFIEGLLVIMIALFGGNHVDCAIGLVGARASSVVVSQAILSRKISWLRLSLREANSREIRRLLSPALGAMAIPLSLALNIQGVVLIIAGTLSPAMAANYSAVRTISRVAVQMVGILGRASMPELAASNALGNNNRVRQIIRFNITFLLITILPGAFVFGFFGQEIVDIWTRGALNPPVLFICLMAAGMVLQAIWTLATQMLLATNSHGTIAVVALLSSFATVALSIPAAIYAGIIGVAAATLLSDAFVVAFLIWMLINNRNRAAL